MTLYFHLDDSTPTPGVRDVLQQLSAMDVTMGVISNHLFGSDVLQEHLSRHDLCRYFRVVMSSAGFKRVQSGDISIESRHARSCS
jgi:phosphoglycolate phosphatase-like HAD superfamily hydrolase